MSIRNISIIDEGIGGELMVDEETGDLLVDNTPYSLIYLSLFSGDSPLDKVIASDSKYPTSDFANQLNKKQDENWIKETSLKAKNSLSWLEQEGILVDIKTEIVLTSNEQISIKVYGVIPTTNKEYTADFKLKQS